MKHKKIACAAVTAILAANVTAYAAGGSTTVTVNVPGNTDYTMTIPATTEVANYGWTELASPLKVQGNLSTGKQVEVRISSANDYQFVNEDQSKSIAYALRQSQSGAAVSSLVFQSEDLGDSGKTLGVYVERDAWNAVPGGSYSDVLTFAAKTVNAGK